MVAGAARGDFVQGERRGRLLGEQVAALDEAFLAEVKQQRVRDAPEFQVTLRLHKVLRCEVAPQPLQLQHETRADNDVRLEHIRDPAPVQQLATRLRLMFDPGHAQFLHQQFVIETLIHARPQFPVNFHGLADDGVTEFVFRKFHIETLATKLKGISTKIQGGTGIGTGIGLHVFFNPRSALNPRGSSYSFCVVDHLNIACFRSPPERT